MLKFLLSLSSAILITTVCLAQKSADSVFKSGNASVREIN
jgi:hypothetical protein